MITNKKLFFKTKTSLTHLYYLVKAILFIELIREISK